MPLAQNPRNNPGMKVVEVLGLEVHGDRSKKKSIKMNAIMKYSRYHATMNGNHTQEQQDRNFESESTKSKLPKHCSSYLLDLDYRNSDSKITIVSGHMKKVYQINILVNFVHRETPCKL